MSGSQSPNIIQKAKVTHHAWADPKPIPEGQTRKLIGTVVGRSIGIKHGTMPNGDPFKGLRGQFEATNADTGEITVAGVCFLPSGFHDLVLAKYENLPEGERDPVVEFAYRVFSVRAPNAHGFSYAFEPVLKPETADDLAHLREALTAKGAPKIEAPKAGDKKAA